LMIVIRSPCRGQNPLQRAQSQQCNGNAFPLTRLDDSTERNGRAIPLRGPSSRPPSFDIASPSPFALAPVMNPSARERTEPTTSRASGSASSCSARFS
jgi:hypothetical protein